MDNESFYRGPADVIIWQIDKRASDSLPRSLRYLGRRALVSLPTGDNADAADSKLTIGINVLPIDNPEALPGSESGPAKIIPLREE